MKQKQFSRRFKTKVVNYSISHTIKETGIKFNITEYYVIKFRKEFGFTKFNDLNPNKIDLNKYMGRWFEIAKFPLFFQKKCDSNVVAEYKLEDNGKVKVENTCRTKDGKLINAKGKAKLTDEPNILKLKFNTFLPSSEYIIEYVDKDYQYAIVGNRSKDNMWILSRQKALPDEDYDYLIKKAKSKGYNIKKLSKTID